MFVLFVLLQQVLADLISQEKDCTTLGNGISVDNVTTILPHSEVSG